MIRSLYLLLFFGILTFTPFAQLGDFLLKTSEGRLLFQIHGETVDPFAQYDAANTVQKIKKIGKPKITDKKFTFDSAMVNFRIFETTVKNIVDLKFYYLEKAEPYLVHVSFKNETSFKNFQNFTNTLFQEVKISKGEPGITFRSANYKVDPKNTGSFVMIPLSVLVDQRGGKKEAFIGVSDIPQLFSSSPEFGYPAIEVDYNAMSEQKKFEYYNLMASELYEVVMDAQNWYKSNAKNTFKGYKIPDNLKESPNCVFTIESVNDGEISLLAISKLTVVGNDGKNPLMVRFLTRPDDMQPEVAN